MQLPSFAKISLSVKGKLLISTLLQLLLVVFFGAFLVVSSRQINAITASEAKVNKIVQTLTEMRFVTFENLLNQNERSYKQWQSKHKELTGLLETVEPLNNREKILLDSIRTQQKTVEPIFAKLIASFKETPQVEASQIVAQNRYQERLASQIVSKQQIEITSAFKLASLKREQANVIREKTGSLTATVIILMFLITAVNLIFIYNTITRALALLQAGAGEISKGRLGYRIKVKNKNDEFDKLATEFNNMASSLEKADKVKSEFVMLVSHQLRTPATAVKGFISLLVDYHSKNLSSKQRGLLDLAYEENERQIMLINEILAIAQVETGDMILNKKLVDLPEIIKTVLEEQEMNFDARKQKIELNYPKNLHRIMADSERIRIVIENLIHNASKFSPEGATIGINIKENEKITEISVTDNGEGISKNDQEKLFKKFSRLSTPSTVKTEGTGLGLYLAKQIVDLHKGKISVSSEVGIGTTFAVQLPNNTKG